MDITIDGAIAYLEGVGELMTNGDFSAELESVTGLLELNFVNIFAGQVAASGEAWPAHAPATVRMYGPHPLLILSGALYDSLTSPSGGGVRNISPQTYEFGTDIDYAGYNNFGTGRIPPREFMFWSDGIALEVLNAMEEAISAKVLS